MFRTVAGYSVFTRPDARLSLSVLEEKQALEKESCQETPSILA